MAFAKFGSNFFGGGGEGCGAALLIYQVMKKICY